MNDGPSSLLDDSDDALETDSEASSLSETRLSTDAVESLRERGVYEERLDEPLIPARPAPTLWERIVAIPTSTAKPLSIALLGASLVMGVAGFAILNMPEPELPVATTPAATATPTPSRQPVRTVQAPPVTVTATPTPDAPVPEQDMPEPEPTAAPEPEDTVPAETPEPEPPVETEAPPETAESTIDPEPSDTAEPAEGAE